MSCNIQMLFYCFRFTVHRICQNIFMVKQNMPYNTLSYQLKLWHTQLNSHTNQIHSNRIPSRDEVVSVSMCVFNPNSSYENVRLRWIFPHNIFVWEEPLLSLQEMILHLYLLFDICSTLAIDVIPLLCVYCRIFVC